MSTAFPPTLKQLKYLSAIAKTLHFGRAAELCHVTQSTLSAGLQELESLLDAKLVERNKRLVMLTPLGAEIADRADAILTDVDDLMGLAATANNPRAGSVRMGVIPTIAPFLLPRAMPALQEALPDLEFFLFEDKSAELCEQLKSGALDVVLYAIPYPCGDCVERVLFDDPFVAAYPAKDAPTGPIRMDDLKDETLLLLDEGHCLRGHALAACGLVDKHEGGTLAGTSLHTLVHMVAAGRGVTLLPQMAIDAGLLRGLDVTVVAFQNASPARKVGLIWRKTNPRAETFALVGQAIKEAVS